VLDEPPAPIEARPGFYSEEVAFWLPEQRAIVLGDGFIDGNTAPQESQTDDPEAPARLRALLDLPFELVLPTHGDITDREQFIASLEE
jgi:glyoxylase-like metal-dependent hydrolase (beta-lactamase superfamily II)